MSDASNMRLGTIIALITCSVLFFTCGPKDDGPWQPPISENSARFALVVNEGNFQWGNATLDLVDLDNYIISNSYFQAINNRPLGDVAQSMTIEDSLAYVVVNNSGKVEVVNINNGQSLGQITGFSSPRYLAVNGSTAYVSELYDEKLYIVDLNSLNIEGEIAVQGWTERMLVHNDELIVLNQPHPISGNGDAGVVVLSLSTQTITRELQLNSNPIGIVQDVNGTIWIQTEGDSLNGEYPRLLRFNATNHSVVVEYEWPGFSGFRDLDMSLDGNTIYALGQDLHSYKIQEQTTELFISGQGRNLYACSVNPFNGNIYLSDAKGYVERGEVLEYDIQGNLMHQYETGVIPSEIYFYEK